ncbi:unnamed protein product [Pleuronectes platessa]|uniref:Uncharacterized protein n=1 Tax=Pleuronectes platessa TaxID=8262 RepID=A0A9N7VF39_PLEPL|nr:unnamed protein product [Pleuronectes platessa]
MAYFHTGTSTQLYLSGNSTGEDVSSNLRQALFTLPHHPPATVHEITSTLLPDKSRAAFMRCDCFALRTRGNSRFFPKDTPSQLNEGDGLISGEPLWPKRHLLLMLMSSGDNNWAQRGTGPQPASQTPSTLHGLSTICQTASGWTEDLATQSWGEDGGVGDM